MDQRPDQGLYLPLTWWPLCLAECRSLWWKLSRCWRRTAQTRIVPSWRKSQEKLQERRWPPAGPWPSLVHIVAFKDGLTPDWFCYFFFFMNLESRKNNFYALLISSELRKIWMFQNFSLFSVRQEQTSFPWHVALELSSTCGVCVHGKLLHTSTQGYRTAVRVCFFILFYVFWALQSFPKAEFHSLSKDTYLLHVVIKRSWKYSSIKTNHDISCHL